MRAFHTITVLGRRELLVEDGQEAEVVPPCLKIRRGLSDKSANALVNDQSAKHVMGAGYDRSPVEDTYTLTIQRNENEISQVIELVKRARVVQDALARIGVPSKVDTSAIRQLSQQDAEEYS